MNAKNVRIANILTAAMLILNLGCIIGNLLLSWLTRLVAKNIYLSLPTGIFLCLALILPSVVLLICGIKQAKRKQGAFDLICSIVTLVVGIAWACIEVLEWAMIIARNVIIELYYRIDIDMPLGDLIALLNYFSIAATLFTMVVGLYLLATYVISVLRSKQKWLQVKAELHKPTLAVLLIVPSLLSFLQMILNRVLIRISLDVYTTYAQIFSYVTLAVNVVLLLSAIVVLLTFGLILKKQGAAAQTEQPVQNAHAFADMDLPAGVSADDL